MIRFESSKWEGLDGMGEEILRELKPRAENAMMDGLVRFTAELKTTLTGPRSGRTYIVSKTGKPHVASAPGEPPAVLFGHLRNSMGHSKPRWNGLTVEGEVGSGLGVSESNEQSSGYARRLEYGGADSRGVKIEKRPYMEPTVERMEPILTKLFEEQV